MKIGCCINSFSKEGDPLGLGILPTLKALGYDYAEVSIAGFSDLSDEDFEKVASVVEKSSIPVEAGCILVTGGLNVYGDWEPVETYLHKAFSRASRLGLKVMVFGSGRARSVPEGSSKEETFQKFADLLKQIGKIAASHGITVVIEPLNTRETDMITNLAEGAQLAKAVNHPNVQLLADYYHMAQEKDSFSSEALAILRHAHYAEPTTRTYPQQLDEGSKAFFEQLKQSGYAGRISIEASAPNGEEYLRRFIELVQPWH